jgi:hypothetical protein
VKAEGIEIKNGNITVPIYEFADGRFCVDTMLGQKRKRMLELLAPHRISPKCGQSLAPKQTPKSILKLP